MTRKIRLSFASVLALAIAVLLLTTAVVCVADVSNAYADDAAASVSVWDGTSSDTSWYNDTDTEFYISTAAQLVGFIAKANDSSSNKFQGKTVYLTTDIDLNNKELPDNCGIYAEFYGTLDGKGHTIRNFKQNFSRAGFFNANFHGTAKNIIFKNADITSSGGAGVFAYDITSDTALIDNIIIDTCTVNSTGKAGGIVSWTDCTIKNCLVKNSTIISTTEDAGGIVGEGQKYKGTGLIYNCGSIGNTVTAGEGNYSGKIIGDGLESGVTESCYGDGVLVGHNDGTYVEKNNRTDVATIEGFDLSFVSLVDGAKVYVSTKSFDNIIVNFVAVPSALSVKENGEAVDFNLTDKTLTFATSAGAHTYVLEYTVLDVQYTTKIVVGAPEAPQIVRTLDGAELASSSNFLINKDGVSYVCDTDSADSNKFAIGFASPLAEGAKAIVKYGGNSVTITGGETADLGKLSGAAYTVEYYYNDCLVSSDTYNDIVCLKSLGVDNLYYSDGTSNPWVLSDDVNGIKGMYSSESIKGVGYSSSTVDLIAINTNHVSFNVASSSERQYDCVKIFLNGTQYKQKNGDEQTVISQLSWEKVTFDFEFPEFNIITLNYSKDSSGDSGNDTGYVNDFRGGIVSVPNEAEYVVTVDGKDSKVKFQNGGTISVDYDKPTSLSLTAPIVEVTTCELYLNGKKSDKTPGIEQDVYFFFVEDAKKYAEVQFVYNKAGLDSAPFTYNIDFEPSHSMQDNLVIGGNVTVDCSDYKDKTEEVPYLGTAKYLPFGFNGNLSASKGWLVYSSTSQGVDLSVSGIKLIIKESGLLTFDYYISSDDSKSAPYDSVYRSNEAITYQASQTTGRYFVSNKTSSEDVDNARVGSTGEIGWKKFELSIDLKENETYVLHLAYVKGASDSAGDDTFAIANVLLNSGVKSVKYSADDANGGSVSAKKSDGTSVASGESVVMGSEITLSATAKDGYKVYGWQNVVTGEFIASSSVKVTVVDNTEYKAIIKPIGTYTALVGNTLYATINEAQTANPEGTIYVIEDCTLTDFTLLQGVTLTLTYSQSDRTGYAQGGGNDRTSWNCGTTPYVTLTVNGKLTLNGKLIVGGVQHKADQSAQGHTSGAYAQMIVNGSIEIANGGYLDVIGRVIGNGTITAKAGATLRQPFTVNNYSGGTNTYALYNAGQFPFVQFATSNVECDQVVEYGAKVIGSTSLYFWSSITTQDVVLVDKIENRTAESEGALIWMHEGSSLEISYDSSKKIDAKVGNIHLGDFGVTTIAVYGNITAGEFSLQGYGSGAMVLAIPYTYNFNIKSGATVNINQAYKIMPGAIVTIENGATVNITENGKLYVYDGLYQSSKNGKRYPYYDELAGYGFAKSGMLIVNGTLNINGTFAGIVQTVEGGEINVGANANVANQTIVDGCNDGYDYNMATFDMSGRVYGVNGFVSLEKGKTYRMFANNAFTLNSFANKYSVGVKDSYSEQEFALNPNQAMQGRFAQWNGQKFVLTLTFYIGADKDGVIVNVNGSDYQTDSNGRFTCSVEVANATDLIKYYTKNVYTAVKSQTLVLDQEMQTLTHVASNVALKDGNSYMRVRNKDGEITQDFSLFAIVSFYGTTDTESVELSFDESTLNPSVYINNVALTNSSLVKSIDATLKVVGSDVAQFINDVGNLKNANDIVATACNLYATYGTLSSKGTGDDVAFITDYLNGYIGFASNIVKEITIVGSATYGDGSIDIKVTYVNGTTATATATLSNVQWDSNQSKVVGTATFNGKHDGKNYTVSKTCDVNRKTATVKIKPQSSLYGDQIVIDNSLVDISGIIDGDDLGITLTREGNSTNVGEYVLGGTWTNRLYFVTFENGKYTIMARPVTVTIDDKSSVYGDSLEKLTASASGLADGDTIDNLNVTLTKADGRNVGDYAITGIANSANYIVTFVNGTYTITQYKAKVVITKPHNLMEGKTAVTIFASVQGAPDANYAKSLTYELRVGDVLIARVDLDGKISVVDGQTLSCGKYDIIAVNGNDNYVIETQNDMTLEVVEANNYYEVDFGDSEKIYDGITFVPTAVVKVRETDVEVTEFDLKAYLGSKESKILNVGKYTIVLTISTDGSEFTHTFEVKERPVTVTIDDKSSVYGESLVALTYSIEQGAVVEGDSLGITLTKADGRNVGEYAITGAASNTNYAVTFVDGKYTIGKRSITVNIDDKTSVYGEDFVELTASATGYVYDDEYSSLDVTLTKADGRSVGEYAITGIANSANYIVTFKKGTYTITAKAIAVVIDNVSAVYGDSIKALTSRLKEGSELAYTDSMNDLGITLKKEGGMNFGDYDIIGSASNTNYAVTFEKGTYTINKKTVNVNINRQTSVYGESLVALTYSIEQGAVVEGDDLGIILKKVDGLNVGEYEITGSATNVNYEVKFKKATYTITKRAVTLLVQDATTVYGNPDATLTVLVREGTMAEGEDAQSLVSITRTAGRTVGTYAITATKVENANYDVTIAYTSAAHSEYTITKRPVTVTVQNAQLPYTATWAELNAALEYEANGLAGDNLNVRLFVLVGDVELTEANFNSMFASGKHAISATIDNDNYKLTVVNGELTVGLSVVSLTNEAREITRVYGNTQNIFDWRTMLTGYLASATDNSFRAKFYSSTDTNLTTQVDIATADAGTYKMQIEIVHTTEYTFEDGSNKSELVDVIVEKADVSESIVITLVGLTNGRYLVFSYGLSIDASVTGHDDIEIVKVLTKDGAATDDIDAVGAYEYTATIQDTNYQGVKTLQFKVVNSAKDKIEDLKKYSGVEFLTKAQYTQAKALVESITEDDMLQINDNAEAKANYENAATLCAKYAKIAENLDAIKAMLDAYAAGESKKLAEAHDYIVALDEEKLTLVKQSEECKAYQEAWQAARVEGREATEIANKVRDNALFGIVAAVSALLAMAYVAFGKFRG